jgi:hypothetical protein
MTTPQRKYKQGYLLPYCSRCISHIKAELEKSVTIYDDYELKCKHSSVASHEDEGYSSARCDCFIDSNGGVKLSNDHRRRLLRQISMEEAGRVKW